MICHVIGDGNLTCSLAINYDQIAALKRVVRRGRHNLAHSTRASRNPSAFHCFRIDIRVWRPRGPNTWLTMCEARRAPKALLKPARSPSCLQDDDLPDPIEAAKRALS